MKKRVFQLHEDRQALFGDYFVFVKVIYIYSALYVPKDISQSFLFVEENF